MNELFTKEFDSDSNDEEYVPTKKELEASSKENTKVLSESEVIANKSKVDAMWEKLKAKSGAPKKEEIKEESKEKKEEVNEKPKESLSLDDQIKAALKKAKEQKAKLITDTYYFAGQKFTETKEVDDKEVEKMKKKQTHRGLDNIIEQISKKKNISTIDKSKKDWKTYVEEKKLEKELSNNRKDGFLGKKQFLDQANAIIYEQNKLSIKKAKYAYDTKVNSK